MSLSDRRMPARNDAVRCCFRLRRSPTIGGMANRRQAGRIDIYRRSLPGAGVNTTAPRTHSGICQRRTLTECSERPTSIPDRPSLKQLVHLRRFIVAGRELQILLADSRILMSRSRTVKRYPVADNERRPEAIRYWKDHGSRLRCRL